MNLLIGAKMVVPEQRFYWENLRPDSCGFVAFGEGGNEHLQFTITPSKRVNVCMCLIYIEFYVKSCLLKNITLAGNLK